MKLTRLAPLTLVLLLGGCLQPLPLETLPPPPPPPMVEQPKAVTFSEADFAWSTQPGAGRIEGRFTYGNGRYSCAGAGVVLTPETPWVRERMQTLYGATSGAAQPVAQVRARTPAASENYSAYVRSTTCDAQGRFSFQGLPAGAWYMITVARSTAPGGGEDMAVMRRVETVQGAINADL